MVLMSVDFPQPFGPRIHTCSPAAISRFTFRSATRSPRMTVTFLNERRGGATVLRQVRQGVCDSIPATAILTESHPLWGGAGKPRRKSAQACDAKSPLHGWHDIPAGLLRAGCCPESTMSCPCKGEDDGLKPGATLEKAQHRKTSRQALKIKGR